MHIRPFTFSNFFTFNEYILPPVIQCGLNYLYFVDYILLHSLLHNILHKPAPHSSSPLWPVPTHPLKFAPTTALSLRRGYFRISHSLLTYILYFLGDMTTNTSVHCLFHFYSTQLSFIFWLQTHPSDTLFKSRRFLMTSPFKMIFLTNFSFRVFI